MATRFSPFKEPRNGSCNVGKDWPAMGRCWRTSATLRVLGLLLLGQLLSFSIALASLTSSRIAQLGVDAPLTQSLVTYASLALVYGSVLVYRRQKPLIWIWIFEIHVSWCVVQVSWYWYLLLGFADVQGNYLVNKAYQYASITSVTLLSCSTVPWVIVLTRIFLGTRYSFGQLSGSTICVLGLCLVLLSDFEVGGGGGSRPFLGDVLVILGTFFYGISSVGEEFCVKRKDLVEAVCMLGVYGFLVTVVEISIIELKTLGSVTWSTNIVLAFAGFALSSFMFCTFAPFVLKMSGALMFNLSLLTSGMWAVVFKVFLYNQEVLFF
ncbi:hypothetical protein RJT34_19633 [Clitoria ternatea]|uniref:Uncharacterized protein n=1 Tax=Clitoria ternatea TaxID=43366 RepID=A0AAN9IRJ6_CLITE